MGGFGEARQSLRVMRILQPLPIVQARAPAQSADSSGQANFADHSSDMGNNGSFVSAKKNVACSFILKE